MNIKKLIIAASVALGISTAAQAIVYGGVFVPIGGSGSSTASGSSATGGSSAETKIGKTTDEAEDVVITTNLVYGSGYIDLATAAKKCNVIKKTAIDVKVGEAKATLTINALTAASAASVTLKTCCGVVNVTQTGIKCFRSQAEDGLKLVSKIGNVETYDVSTREEVRIPLYRFWTKAVKTYDEAKRKYVTTTYGLLLRGDVTLVFDYRTKAYTVASVKAKIESRIEAPVTIYGEFAETIPVTLD